MRRPKLIFVNRVFWPSEAATAQLLTDLAAALAARGRDVHVIAAGDGAPEFRGVTIHRTGAEPAGRLARYGHFLRGARRELRRLVAPGDVVILKTDPPLLAVAATELARAHGARVVQWIQDIYPEVLSAHLGAWAAPALLPLRLARNRAWRASALCVPVSDDMRATVLAAGVAPDRAVALPNWAPPELDLPARPDDIAAVRREWGAGDALLAVYSGNLGRVHEFATLLDAAALLRDEPRVRLAFVGGGPRSAEVRAAVAARGLANVAFFPAQPRARLAAALAAADAHFVTLRPGFERLVAPSKLAGVLAAGRPALFVGPRPSGLAALLDTEGGGHALANGDATALAATLRAWNADRTAAAASGVAGRCVYERHFRFVDLVARWDALLESTAAD
ncbi:glycosyltransferase [Oleiharenicola sp. Vm1]|uniref:glycosyltransferase n=1 Tax=Oleiharenicola sp. Vm1 TaxID=3398393 RepID=UPI0039F57FA3